MQIDRSALDKARELAAYLSAKYGSDSLGIFRLLCSIPYFRRAILTGRLGDLLGMSLLSFEKYLREQQNIVYHYDSKRINDFVVTRNDGGRSAPFRITDDRLRSAGGAIVSLYRDEFPEASDLSGVPLFSLGAGGRIADILDNIDHKAVSENETKMPTRRFQT